MKQINVMLAEDNDLLRTTLENELTKYDEINLVAAVKSGTEALELLTKENIDVVVSDLVLAGIDGFSLMEKCKENKIGARFLITSSLSSETFINKSIELGAFYYMIKPVETSLLVSRIKLVSEDSGENSRQQPQTSKNKMLEEKISNIFITVGIPAHIKGYQFLREAIKLATERPEIINSITKELYPSIAKRFATTSSKVERAIRHAIEVAWNRGKIENINDVFGIKVYNSNEKPTNGEFIALVADKMLIEG